MGTYLIFHPFFVCMIQISDCLCLMIGLNTTLMFYESSYIVRDLKEFWNNFQEYIEVVIILLFSIILSDLFNCHALLNYSLLTTSRMVFACPACFPFFWGRSRNCC